VPEGDTVWRTARSLDRALSGKPLTVTDFRVPAFATWDLTGATVRETVSRGKHLLTRVDADSEWTLHTHLKMEGAWTVLRSGQRWPRPAHTARVVLSAGDAVAVGFSLGIVEIVPRDREHEIVGHLGPDLLGPDWDPAEAVRRLLEQPDRAIGEALLDQRCLAGLGTIYMSETLFLSGVSPLTPVDHVHDVTKVVRMGHRLLMFNRERPTPVTTGNTARGQEHYVYLRTGQPCRRCGATIVTAMVGPATQERRTYWCPSCQPGIRDPGRSDQGDRVAGDR
jgi:endonuclease-8